MSVELGSVWIDNDSDLLVIVKSLEAKFDGKVTVIFNYIVRTGDKSIESASELDLFLKTKTKLVRHNDSDYEKGYVEGYNQHEYEMHQLMSERELDLKAQAYEEGYESGRNQWQDDYGFTVPNNTVQSLKKAAYAKGLKEGKEFNKDDQNLNYRVGYNDGWHDCEASFELGNEFTDSIQEQAYDEGYDQAIDDLIEAGVIGESDEDCSDEDCSEYEFGDVEDEEEEYCFSKELDRILNGEKAQYEVDPTDLPTFGGRYDENGKLCGFFINTGEASKGDYKLVGISGLARSGKDVAGEIILENLGEGWSRGAFADIPKEMLFVMGVDTKCFNKDGEDEYYQYNIRHLMQTLGTDWGRNIDNDIWIKAFKKKNPTGNFVITDVRMENEADFVRDNGGVIIHVKGRGGIKGNHQSEAGIEIKRGDLLVFNDSDLANFEKEINNICKTLVKKV